VNVARCVLAVRWSSRVIRSAADGGKTVVTSPGTGKRSPGFGCAKLTSREAIPALV
jgi:hypothetical protein